MKVLGRSPGRLGSSHRCHVMVRTQTPLPACNFGGLQDPAQRSALIRVEGSRAVPAMLLAEATKRLNVGFEDMATHAVDAMLFYLERCHAAGQAAAAAPGGKPAAGGKSAAGGKAAAGSKAAAAAAGDAAPAPPLHPEHATCELAGMDICIGLIALHQAVHRLAGGS